MNFLTMMRKNIQAFAEDKLSDDQKVEMMINQDDVGDIGKWSKLVGAPIVKLTSILYGLQVVIKIKYEDTLTTYFSSVGKEGFNTIAPVYYLWLHNIYDPMNVNLDPNHYSPLFQIDSTFSDPEDIESNSTKNFQGNQDANFLNEPNINSFDTNNNTKF